MKEHVYDIGVEWTGNTGAGTRTFGGYKRDHVIEAAGKPPVPGSSDPHFRGDPSRYNPEEMLVASLSACHMLWYLHLCSVNGIVVTAYRDAARGWMSENADGSGEFTRVVLRPRVTIEAGDAATASRLHHDAHGFCFIARSVKFPVDVEPEFAAAG